VRKVITIAIVSLGISTPIARAADIRVISSLIQTADFNSNYLLQNNPPGEITAPVSTLRVDGIARTPTTLFETVADLSYRSYFGPGTDALRVNDALDKLARARLEQTDKLTTYNVAASWSQRQAAPLQVAQTGVGTISGFVNTTIAEAGVRHELTPSDRLSWQTFWTSTDFTDPTSVPFTDFSSTGEWTRRLSATTALIPSVQLEELNYEGPAKTEIMLWRLMMGVRSDLSARLNIHAAAGALLATARASASNVPSAGTLFLPSVFQPSGTVVLPSGIVQSVPVTSGSAQSSSASASDWLANARVTYNFDSTTSLTAVAAQTVAADSFGNIFKADSVGFALRRQVNYSTNLSLAGDATRLTSVGTRRDFYTLAATYCRRLTREWDTAIIYTFRQRYDQTGSANSHSVFVLVRREVTIIP
jgi:hypothetical protein